MQSLGFRISFFSYPLYRQDHGAGRSRRAGSFRESFVGRPWNPFPRFHSRSPNIRFSFPSILRPPKVLFSPVLLSGAWAELVPPLVSEMGVPAGGGLASFMPPVSLVTFRLSPAESDWLRFQPLFRLFLFIIQPTHEPAYARLAPFVADSAPEPTFPMEPTADFTIWVAVRVPAKIAAVVRNTLDKPTSTPIHRSMMFGPSITANAIIRRIKDCTQGSREGFLNTRS